MRILKRMSKGPFKPKGIFQSWLLSLIEKSVLWPRLCQNSRDLWAGGPHCGWVLCPDHRSFSYGITSGFPAPEIRFYIAITFFWLLMDSYLHCECISHGMWKELAPPWGKTALELLAVHTGPDSVLVTWTNLTATEMWGIIFQPSYTAWWALTVNFISIAHFWAVPTAIRNCGKNCSGIFLESGKTPQFSIGQWNPLQCAFQQKNSQPDLQCFFIFFNSWKMNSMLKLHFNWFSSLIWPQFTNADCLCQAFIHCFYFLSPACQ